ncbi:MAG: SbcC/MukB-like Walker B domain-containing protein [Cyclobacteriaceae bacterium]
MWSLFSTSSDKAGFRLQYMEVFNWGTFYNDRVFRIQPQGNNSLLTGANASGKSTFIDALLTLMVPTKKDRFYNQSSGVEKKGDRTEETYVLGNYGSIQKEGEYSTSTQSLRDKGTYSVILASFSNTDQKTITLFQVRWFSNGELKRTFGIAHIALEIESDFSQFDSKGVWKKRLDKTYNLNSNKRKVEFLDGPTSYAERIWNLFGMRSVNALSLFNHIVGVKVLEDLDEFIRTNMLEKLEPETEFIQLKESFLTLMDAKTNIEKAKEQISQLTPINQIAIELQRIQIELTRLNLDKEVAVYWFAKKNIELSEKELQTCEEKLSYLNEELNELKFKEDSLKQEERSISLSIERDEVGGKIKELEKEIKQLEKSRDLRKSKLNDYNKLAQSLELSINPGEETFQTNREHSKQKKVDLEIERSDKDETLRLTKNELDRIKNEIEDRIETIKSLQKNKNNIPTRVSEIRDDTLAHVGATKEEIPFIGELIKVKDEETLWESSIEKIFHNLALRLIVPERYYGKVNEYVNQTNLRGRIIYQRYQKYTSLASMRSDLPPQNSLLNKIEFKPKNIYSDWLEDVLTKNYNYSCVKDLEDFALYDEKAITKEGLIKFGKGKHEKDDRPHVTRKENYVLGWDNKEKISLLKNEVRKLQEDEQSATKKVRSIEQNIKAIDKQKEEFSDLFKLFTKFDDIDWETFALEIQDKESQKSTLEKTNNRVKELQNQLTEVQERLTNLTNIEIGSKNREIYDQEANIKLIREGLEKSRVLIDPLGERDTKSFELKYPNLSEVDFQSIKRTESNFQQEISREVSTLETDRRKNEDEVKLKINAFKQPTEEITNKFKDWRSDVNSLPESINLDLISEYQDFLQRLTEDNLPKFEKKFNDYLQETITGKIGNFRIFFTDWADSIKENINRLNDSLSEIAFKSNPNTYIQLVASNKVNQEISEFRSLLENAMPNIRELDSVVDGRKKHFNNHIVPLINRLENEDWRKKVMEVRSWFNYKAEEFYKETYQKFKTYENMGQLSGGEKAQLTYTILGSAIAYQFGLTKEGLQSNSFRFIAIDEAFKAQDEDKARYLITLCKQLHLQLLVVTPSDNIHIVENDISFVHFVERKEEKYSWLYDMPIEQFQEEKAKFILQ